MRTGAASTRQPKGRNDGTGRGEAVIDNPLDQAKLHPGETGIDPGDFGAQVGLRHHGAEVEAGCLMLGGLTDSRGDGVSLFRSQVGIGQAARDRVRVEHPFVYSIAAEADARVGGSAVSVPTGLGSMPAGAAGGPRDMM